MSKKKRSEGFAVTQHKGVRITFANKWSISIQWGPGNYCEAGEFISPKPGEDFKSRWLAPTKADEWASPDAEIALFTPDGNFWRPDGEDWGDDVKGHCTPDEVLVYMSMISAKGEK